MDDWLKEVKLDTIDSPDKLVPTRDNRIPADGRLDLRDEAALVRLRADFLHEPDVRKAKALLKMASQFGDSDAAADVMLLVDLEPRLGGG